MKIQNHLPTKDTEYHGKGQKLTDFNRLLRIKTFAY